MGKVIALPNYKPDDFLDKVRQARKASKLHEECMKLMQSGGPYSKEDVSRELGYQEALSLCEFWYKRRARRD